MKKRLISIALASVMALSLAGCGGSAGGTTTEADTSAPADTTAPTQTESQTEASAEETTKPDETPSETQVPEDTESTKFYMLQGTVTKAEKDGSAFTLLADDGNEYTIALSDIRDVETEIEKNIQIAIACMKDASGDPEKAAYIVAFPEQEEWTISTDEGITTSNAMSTFMIQTSDGREIGFIKDNCPSDENALTSDSGDSVIVTYVTSDNANFPLRSGREVINQKSLYKYFSCR